MEVAEAVAARPSVRGSLDAPVGPALLRRLVELAGWAHAHAIYPPKLTSPNRERRFEVGEAMYRHVGIPQGRGGAAGVVPGGFDPLASAGAFA